jgi:hypothetical protein
VCDSCCFLAQRFIFKPIARLQNEIICLLGGFKSLQRVQSAAIVNVDHARSERIGLINGGQGAESPVVRLRQVWKIATAKNEANVMRCARRSRGLPDTEARVSPKFLDPFA